MSLNGQVTYCLRVLGQDFKLRDLKKESSRSDELFGLQYKYTTGEKGTLTKPSVIAFALVYHFHPELRDGIKRTGNVDMETLEAIDKVMSRNERRRKR